MSDIKNLLWTSNIQSYLKGQHDLLLSLKETLETLKSDFKSLRGDDVTNAILMTLERAIQENAKLRIPEVNETIEVKH